MIQSLLQPPAPRPALSLQKKKSFLSLSNSWAPQENLGGLGKKSQVLFALGGLETGGHRCLVLEKTPAALSFSERHAVARHTA